MDGRFGLEAEVGGDSERRGSYDGIFVWFCVCIWRVLCVCVCVFVLCCAVYVWRKTQAGGEARREKTYHRRHISVRIES